MTYFALFRNGNLITVVVLNQEKDEDLDYYNKLKWKFDIEQLSKEQYISIADSIGAIKPDL